MELIEIVNKLIGDTSAHGCSNRDVKSLENLEVKCDLIERLVSELQRTAVNKRSHESSVKDIGDKATKFLKELKEEL